jgi:tetratricopeptide (TPR) repeat protein
VGSILCLAPACQYPVASHARIGPRDRLGCCARRGGLCIHQPRDRTAGLVADSIARLVYSDVNMTVRPKLVCGLAMLLGVHALAGCSEPRARHHARLGNQFFRDGDYAAAVREYREADRLRPGLAVVLLNLGLACRQLMVPGAEGPENERAVECALRSFQRLRKVRPDDPRAEQLFAQTLFDADRFEKLAAIYERQLRERPNDLAAINSLIQVYSRWNRWEETLAWTVRRAEVQRTDAEAHYAVGVFIQNVLFQKGGGNEKSAFDPRPDPNVDKAAPVFAEGEIAGAERIKLADLGIAHLEKALILRPDYRDAMVYVNLVYRQKSLAFFSEPDKWQACVDAAERWRAKAMKIQVAHKGTG